MTSPAPLTLSRRARALALASHARTYQGPPCPQGHVTRYTANRLCVACAIARRAEQTAQAKDKETML